jgi:hypothetical protein
VNPLIQLKTIPPLLSTLALLCFGLLPGAQAVLPAPDGGYPGGNTAEGQAALLSLTTGGFNTGVGFLSLRSNATGQLNTAIGAGTLLANTGDNNTATGAAALLSNSTGNYNTANGVQALFSNTTGLQNTAVGLQALASNTIGFFNTAVGLQALAGNTTGSGNIAIGYVAGSGITAADNVIAIGTPGADVNDSCYIANIAGRTVGAGGVACYVDNDGKLGVFLSARRFKTDIRDMGAASEALLALRPVTFHYKPELDKTGIPQFGLVAEEVAKVNPDLVTHDAKGELSSVRYDAVNAMLLNEFLKEHKAFVEEQHKVEKLEATVTNLMATVKEQATQIQKVSAQIELSKPAPEVVKSP